MKQARTIAIRTIGFLAVAAGAAAILVPPIEAKREERRIRAMLLTVQEGLQNYHVDEEIYPRRMMKGGGLVFFLEGEGFLEGGVSNPWTGEPYGEGADPDWLRYRTDALAETYELIVTEPDGETVRFRLDSTENQSLE